MVGSIISAQKRVMIKFLRWIQKEFAKHLKWVLKFKQKIARLWRGDKGSSD